MDTDGNGRKPESATTGTSAVSDQPTCAGSRNGRDDSGTADLIPSAASTLASGLRSTVEIPVDDDGAKTDLSIGSTHDADSTPFWDSQATAPSWVESTLGAWKSTMPAPNVSGTEVVPGFEILGELGRGGMGVVYKARQQSLKRLVALKMIRNDWHGNPEHLARFQIEAEAVARLNHPNIVKIYEIGKPGHAPYVVFELLEGGTLKERLAGTPQPFREAAALLEALARGINAAHVAGILHRDLKPSNVLFDQAGIAKIADFGLAKRLEVEEGETHTGQVIGTPSYMAPEQAKGWDRDIGPAADIYSLGAILYEMLTGRPPLKGTTPIETLRLVQDEDPVSPSRLRPKLPFDLETISLKCIARDPRKRYPDALALAEDLDRYLSGESILARRTPFWERGIKRARKRPVTAVLVAVGLIGSGIVVEEVLRAQTHARAEQKEEDDRVTGLLQVTDYDLIEAERALARNRHDDVRVIVARVLSRITADSDPRIARRRDQAERLQAQAQLGLEERDASERARAKFRRFIELRDEALFLDSTRFGDGLGNSVEATRRAARDALGVFGEPNTGDQWALAPLPAGLSGQARDEVKSGFYQLLLILADAVSQPPGAGPAQRADEAIRIVNRAECLLSPATKAYHLRRSDFLEMKGDRQAAARERALAERLAPVDAVDFFLLGRESTRRSDWPTAIMQLAAATQKQPDNFWAQCLLAICYLQTGEPVAARSGLNACLQRKSDQAWLFMLRGIANAGIAQENMGSRVPEKVNGARACFNDAEGDYQKTLQLIGDKTKHADLYYALLINRGTMWLVRDDPAAAAADFQAAISHNPKRFEAFVGLGQVDQVQERTDNALKHFTRAIELRPHWAPLYRGRANAALGVTDISPELRETRLLDLEKAISRLSAERRDAASRDLDDAIRLESPGKHVIAADLTKRALLFRQGERLHDALAACDAALEIAARYPRANEVRIKVLLDLEEYDDLINSCDAVLEWGPQTPSIFELRGMAKSKTGDFAGAIGDFTRSLDLADKADKSRLLRRRGWSNQANEAHRAAIRDFDEALRLAATDADAYLGRGLARARMGLYREAESDAEKALTHGDASPRFSFRVARIYCEAAVAVSNEARNKRQNADRLIRRYDDHAMELVRRAVERTVVKERAAFFHDTILKDPAMKPILKRLMAVERRLIDQPAPR